ncbi:MAG: type II toxin-antitoxin system HicA family toxin [Candidatus Binataceae bacterium]
MASYTAQVKDILRKHNCYKDRSGKGGHQIWHSPISGKKFPVDSNIRSRHTANGILKQAGIKDIKIP